MVVSIQAADRRRRRPWASNRQSTPIRLAPKCEASTSRWESENRCVPGGVDFRRGAGKQQHHAGQEHQHRQNRRSQPDAARMVWRVWNRRWPSLISSNTQATSSGSTT
jgi:hypothetical protein